MITVDDIQETFRSLDAPPPEPIPAVIPRMPTAGMVKQVQGIQRMNRLFNAVIDADHAAIRSLQQRFTGKRAAAKLQRALAKQKKKGRKTYTP